MEQNDFNTTQMDSRERLRTLYLQPGDIIAGNYEFVRELGHGGMGRVYLCRDIVAKGRLMAVKTVPDILRNDDEAIAALTDEYDKMYELRHDDIVSVRHLLKDDFRYYIVMDYLEGETLAAYLKTHRKPSKAVVFAVISRIAGALDYAHGKNPPLVHRDVKPENVMVLIDGETVKSVKLMDFGLGIQIKKSFTRITGEMTSGTPAYKSPEQWPPRRYGKPSSKSDQYSLAAMAYRMLSGDYPFAEYDDDMDVFRVAVLNEVPERIDGIDDYVNDALQKALAKNPKDRFETCMAFVNALKQRPVVVEPPAPQPRQTVVTPPQPVIVTPPQQHIEMPRHPEPPMGRNNLTFTLPGGVPLELIHIPNGTFMMGSPSSESGHYDSEIQHRVTLTKDFWLGKFPVTQEQYQAITKQNPSAFKGATRPVETVNWNDAKGYCDLLNNVFRGKIPAGYAFTLPTEAQWEYACRAGTTTPFNFGSTLNGDKANCDGNYPYCDGNYPYGMGNGKYVQATTEVGKYGANTWGLYDMHGNVWEWCNDWYGAYPTGAVSDPPGASSGSYRVLRGGSWHGHAGYCRSANRYGRDPKDRLDLFGFRVALAPVQFQ